MWSAPAPQPDELSDESLLAGLALSDAEAGTAFIRRFQRRVYGLALSLVGDPTTAEDVAQEAFIRAWRHAPAFDPRRGSVATWLLTITRNLAIDSLRLRRADPTDPEVFAALQLAAPTERSPDDIAALHDDGARLRAALTTLPHEQRRAVVLAAFYGRTALEISTSEGIPLGTAKTRIRAGMRKLRTVLIGTTQDHDQP